MSCPFARDVAGYHGAGKRRVSISGTITIGSGPLFHGGGTSATSKCRAARCAHSDHPDPDRGIVEDRTPGRRPGFRAGQGVDADALLEGGIGPDALDHNHAALNAVESTRMKHDRAAVIAEAQLCL